MRTDLNLTGSLWINRDNRRFLGSDKIQLLVKIDELGSITKAAKAVGICYKTAWDTVNAINAQAEKPLVGSLTGGRGGGGTRLTEEGRNIVAQYQIIQNELSRFLERFQDLLGDPSAVFRTAHGNSYRVSARNIFHGTVTGVVRGAVNSQVSLALHHGGNLTSIVTNDAIDALELASGKDAYAIVKASAVMVGTDKEISGLSTRNLLKGTVIRIVEGAVNSEVDLQVSGGMVISAVITLDSIAGLHLKKGDVAYALFKASDVMIGV